MSDEPNGTPDPQDGDPKPDPEANPPERTFTQTDLDRIVQERLARERQKYAGFDELKEKAAKFDELQERQKSELEKAQERAAKAEKEAADKIAAANKRLIDAAVLAAASAQKVVIKPEHLTRLIDTEKVTVGDDGQVIGAEEAVEAFLKANPDYVGTGRAQGSADQGARSGGGVDQLSRESLVGMTPEQIVAARRAGRLDGMLAGK